MIISVGYRVKSHRGIEFRRWANNVLKQYLINGYAVNERIRKLVKPNEQSQARLNSAMTRKSARKRTTTAFSTMRMVPNASPTAPSSPLRS